MDFALVVAIPFVLGISVYFLRDRLRPVQQGLLLTAGMALLFVFLLAQLPRVTEQGALEFVAPWMPQIGLTFALYVDGLGLLFGLLVTGIGSAVMLYTGCYMDDARQAGRFFALMLAFTGSMLAVVLAGNVVVLFIAWELTSVMSFLLIGFKGADDEARKGALQSLMITGGGGLALFVGLLLLGNAAGTMQLGEILSNGEALRQHPWYGAFTGLILLGCFSKSAQFPLHFWLPQAMNAPTPASAFLHSATMVKAGVYLLARLYPALGDTALWNAALSTVGLATMLVGAVLALRQRDLKGILAYTTISQLGALVALIGQPESAGLKAAAVGIVAHALYKGALFLIAGAVDHTTGTRNINELGGIGRQMRGLAAATAIAGLSMAGVPPLLGFVAKETLLETVIQQPLALAVVTVSAALTVTAALRLFWDVFMGAPRTRLPQPEHVPHDRHHPFGDDAFDYSCCHDLPPLMLASPGTLATLSVIAGVALAPLMAPLVSAAIGKQVSLYLFPPSGVNLALVLSGVALALGIGVFAVRRVWLKWSIPVPVSGVQVYDGTIRAVESVGDVLLKMQSGRIRYYLAVILFSVLVLLATAVPNIRIDLPTPAVQLTTAAHVLEAILLVLALAATLASILFERHLVAALALGIAGYAIGGMFLLEPAPDVALVQFLVETLATVLIIIILARTSQDERRRAMARLWGQTRRGSGARPCRVHRHGRGSRHLCPRRREQPAHTGRYRRMAPGECASAGWRQRRGRGDSHRLSRHGHPD
ncbi:MAG: proton-conducting transporter membrane subunit [Anaerolineae bacterium]|nr:proton-conducting transporter membrane subunit [Anaerolineae bacterium]